MDFSEGIVICRLCLKKITGNCEPIEEIIQYTVNFLTLCPILTISDDPVVCETCALNLKKCFDFKTRCLSTENCISSFGEGEDKKVDLRDIYLKIKLEGNINRVPDDRSVCRFCLELVRDDASMSVMHDRNLTEILQNCFLEMDLGITDDIVACTSCYNSLQFHVKFIKDYESTEEKIDEFCKVEGANNKGQVNLRDVATFMSKITLNVENVNSLIIKEDKEGNIINTNVDVKVKLEDPMEVKQEKEQIVDTKIELKNNDSFQHHPPSQSDCVPQLTRAYFKKNMLKHKYRDTRDAITPGTKYECDLCDYKTKWKSYLTRHTRTHKTDSVQMFKCDLCDYQTKRKYDLKGHVLIHKTHSENTMYRCNRCEYQGRWMFNLQRHMLIHKTHSEVTTYKCDLCDYEALRTGNLKRHMLTHKTHTEVTMHKCDLCDYETKQKWTLSRHMLTHKTSSEATMYKCEACAYETKHKYYLQKHKLKHEDVSEVKMHKCEVCSFETKWKSSFQKHVVTHRNIPHAVM